MRTIVLASLAFTALILAPAAPADAALLTFSWTGTVTEVDAPLASAAQIGDPGSGSFQIESTTPDNDASATFGDYPGPTNMTITLGGLTATSALGTIGGLSVFDFTFDGIELDTGPWTGAPVGAFEVTFAALNMEDADATTFASDAIPTSLTLADFEIRLFRIGYSNGETSAEVRGIVESITVTVPEPAAGALLALGALAAAAYSSATRKCAM
jgi:hypothetical protein